MARALAVASLPLLTILLYSGTLNAPFIFDDRTSITQNLAVQLKLWGILLRSTRPLAELSYVLNFILGGLSPWGYHLGNILLHVANGLLIYTSIVLTLRLPRFAQRYGDGHWAAFAVSLLFLVHPLQTEVVAYISSRNDVLSAFFVFTAMTSLAVALRWRGRRPLAAAARATAAGCGVLAALTKETGAMTPLLLFLLDWAAAGGRPLHVLRAHWLFYIVLGLECLVPGWMLTHHPEYATTAGFNYAPITPIQYLCTQFGVILHYVRVTLIPSGQALDYDWPVVTSLDASAALAGAALLAGFLAAVWFWKSHPLHSFCVFWFFINLAPTSSVIPIADVIAERRMYVPIVGLLGLLVLLIVDATRRLGSVPRRPLAAALAVLLIGAAAGSAALTWQRNILWSSPELMWQDGVRKAPGNPRIHANLGTLYAREGQPERAKAELELAAQLIAAGRSRQGTRFLAAFVYTHLASAYLSLHDVAHARTAFQEALTNGAWREPFLHQRLIGIHSALGPNAPPLG